MILSNVEIVNAIQSGAFSIDGLSALDPSEPPFNTSAVDLRLGSEVTVPKSSSAVQFELRKPNIARFRAQNSEKFTIREEQPFLLKPHTFVLANTIEKVHFSLTEGQCYSARVEGKSSLARCGILVHFTAPVIHAGGLPADHSRNDQFRPRRISPLPGDVYLPTHRRGSERASIRCSKPISRPKEPAW